MAPKNNDPTMPIRRRASQYADVEEGQACSQTSFKTNKKAFLYIGMQGGRYKAMLKLKDSLEEAARLARAEPDAYEIGKGGWVTARFTAERPIPGAVWRPWLEESYQLCLPKTKSAKSKKGAAKREPTQGI